MFRMLIQNVNTEHLLELMVQRPKLSLVPSLPLRWSFDDYSAIISVLHTSTLLAPPTPQHSISKDDILGWHHLNRLEWLSKPLCVLLCWC